MDWDVWVGAAPMRGYNPEYAPFNWRGWVDFGTGALGDMACHILDVVWASLKIGEADELHRRTRVVRGTHGPVLSTAVHAQVLASRAGRNDGLRCLLARRMDNGAEKKYNRPQWPQGLPRPKGGRPAQRLPFRRRKNYPSHPASTLSGGARKLDLSDVHVEPTMRVFPMRTTTRTGSALQRWKTGMLEL